MTRTTSAANTTLYAATIRNPSATRGPPANAAPAPYSVPASQFKSDNRTTPAAATPTTSHHPACTGFPPARTSRRSTGRMSGSLAVRRTRPRAPNRDNRWVRTSQEASATPRRTANTPITAYRATTWIAGMSGHEHVDGVRLREPRSGPAADHVEPSAERGGGESVTGERQRPRGAPAVRRGVVDLVVREHAAAALAADRVHGPVERRRCETAAPARHRGPSRPPVGRRVVRLDDVVVAVGVERPTPDRVHQAVHGRRGEVVAGRRYRRAVAPAVDRGIVDRRRRHQTAVETPATDDDQLTAHGRGAGRTARRRQRGARLPAVRVLAVQPERVFRDEALTGETADGIQRVAHHGEGHMVTGRGEVGDPRPAIRRGIVAERGGAGVIAPVDAAGDVDPPVQRRGGELLHGLGERCGGGAATGRGGGTRAGGGARRPGGGG